MDTKLNMSQQWFLEAKGPVASSTHFLCEDTPGVLGAVLSKQFFVTSVTSPDNSYPRMMQNRSYLFSKYTGFSSKTKYVYRFFFFSAMSYVFFNRKNLTKYIV